MTAPVPYCGDPDMALGLWRTRNATGGVLKLFAGRRVSYNFNTRVAIRKAVDILDLKPGDEVLAPAYNCGSELDPLLYAGLSIRLYNRHLHFADSPHAEMSSAKGLNDSVLSLPVHQFVSPVEIADIAARLLDMARRII